MKPNRSPWNLMKSLPGGSILQGNWIYECFYP
jgi:hypothetical protein